MKGEAGPTWVAGPTYCCQIDCIPILKSACLVWIENAWKGRKGSGEKCRPNGKDGVHSFDANMVNWIYRDIIILKRVLESAEEGRVSIMQISLGVKHLKLKKKKSHIHTLTRISSIAFLTGGFPEMF